jgi:hypothetical protein
MKFPIFLFSIFLLIVKYSTPKEKIIFAWQMNRHGARAPFLGVKNGVDAYKEYWTQIEELSDVGKRMLYLLGVKARKRYVDEYGLLNEKYDPHEIYIRSTDVNRTIESIESFLQGFYPAGTGPTINDSIAFNKSVVYPPNKKYVEKFDEIIEIYNLTENNSALPYTMSLQPIHLFYKPDHQFGLYDSNLCKGHKELYEKQKRRDEIVKFADYLLGNFSFFHNLEEVPIDNNTFMRDYSTLYKYMDGFVCDDIDRRNFSFLVNNDGFGYGFNDTTKAILKNKSDEYLRMDYFETNYPKGHDEIAIMSNSYTLHSIVNWMEEAINKTKNNQSYIKYVIFSAHDSSIGALEHYMYYTFNLTPEYATFAETRFFELYYENENDTEVRVRYIKGDKTEKINMTFIEFKKKIDNTTWTDEEVDKFCQFEKHEEKNDNSERHTLIAAMVILAVIDFILILVLILLCVKQ